MNLDQVETVLTISVHDTDSFEQRQEHEREPGRVVVKEGQPVDSTLGHHGQGNHKHDHTQHSNHYGFVTPSLWELVKNGCGHRLQH